MPPRSRSTCGRRDVRAARTGRDRRWSLEPGNTALGDEGYTLTVGTDAIRITARTPAGVFYGMQTLRQLMPASIEYRAASPHAVSIPAARIEDRPRFAWRGAMLDVARHFFGPGRRPPLHRPDGPLQAEPPAPASLRRPGLADRDQGLAEPHGPRWQHAGGRRPGGFYTQQDYRELVAYARDRFITVIPEIDMPSHINAALASVPELNCDGVAPPLYTGIEVGFSNFCVDKDITYKFIDDVVREIAELTPAPYFHIGGDEVKKITPAQYRTFIERVAGDRRVARQDGDRLGRGGDVEAAPRDHRAAVASRREVRGRQARHEGDPVARRTRSISTCSTTPTRPSASTGRRTWTCPRPTPGTRRRVLPGVNESSILGVEAPIWSETLATMRDVEYLAFPRLAGAAEIAWSPAAGRTWDEYRQRLGAQAQRWTALGINAYWSPTVQWNTDSPIRNSEFG